MAQRIPEVPRNCIRNAESERDERTATEAAHLLLEVKLSRDLLRNPTWLPTSAHQAQAAPGRVRREKVDGVGSHCSVRWTARGWL